MQVAGVSGVPEERRQGVRGAPWGRAKEGRGGGPERGWSHHGCQGAGGQDVTLGLCFSIPGLSLSEVEARARYKTRSSSVLSHHASLPPPEQEVPSALSPATRRLLRKLSKALDEADFPPAALPRRARDGNDC